MEHVEITPPDDVSLDGTYCPYFHHVIELIGRRWTGAILLALSRQPSRFSRLTQQIPGLSDRLLSERITELEREGIVERHQVDEHTVYRLSEKGSRLRPVIDAIEVFAKTTVCDLPVAARPGRRSEAPRALPVKPRSSAPLRSTIAPLLANAVTGFDVGHGGQTPS